MITRAVLKYLLNCFLLVVPALVVDLLLASRLPAEWQFDVFWRDIPPALAYGERISSLVVNILPVFMILRISTLRQRKGLVIYIVGMLAYSPELPKSPGLLALAFLIGTICFASFGFLLGAILPSTRSAQGIGLILFFVMMILGGVWLLQQLNTGNIKPLFLATATPTRSAGSPTCWPS